MLNERFSLSEMIQQTTTENVNACHQFVKSCKSFLEEEIVQQRNNEKKNLEKLQLITQQRIEFEVIQ